MRPIDDVIDIRISHVIKGLLDTLKIGISLGSIHYSEVPNIADIGAWLFVAPANIKASGVAARCLGNSNIRDPKST